jgi:hypothetical protein
MSMFLEVTSLSPKACKLIVNLENIVEIAPLVSGGCVLSFNQIESGGIRTVTVADEYSMFKQFVLQTVSAEDVARIAKKVGTVKKEVAPSPYVSGPQPSAPQVSGADLAIPTFTG